jgi:hypothetical protein
MEATPVRLLHAAPGVLVSQRYAIGEIDRRHAAAVATMMNMVLWRLLKL